MKKVSAKIMSIALAVSSCLAAAGCGGGGNNVSDTEQTLQVYVFEAGYGTKWCTDMLNLFKEQIVGFIDFFYSSPLLHFTVSTLVFIFSLFLIALGFVFSSFFVS